MTQCAALTHHTCGCLLPRGVGYLICPRTRTKLPPAAGAPPLRMDSSSSPKSLASPKTVASSSLDVEAQPEDYSCDAEEGSPPSASGGTRSRRAELGT